ncbi:3'-5' exonuclease domain-containing protein [Artemisia annua]|uniref:3'-5' exonuclease domain-containing protein n=1 Tax=Artemisia annua TaxID=35608 RepID=A0A2U1LS58_ARTAN|nr:3'-5' exonuclease domain-containing protein [Artemisia annua]
MGIGNVGMDSGKRRGNHTGDEKYDFINPVQEIDQNSQKLLESIGSSAESIFSKKNMKFVNYKDDDDVGNKQEERDVKVMDSMESDGFQLVQNRKKKDVLGSESSVGGGENLGNLTSGVKVATSTPKAKVSFYNASIRRPQYEYKILVNNGNTPFEHVWLDRSEDGSKFIHPLVSYWLKIFLLEGFRLGQNFELVVG